MIQIGRPYIEQVGKNFRLTADVVMDQETKSGGLKYPLNINSICVPREAMPFS